MVLLFNYRVRKARRYWCRYRYRALKRENNSELLNKLDDLEKTLRPLEKQESEITRRRSRLEAMGQIKTRIEEIREEIKNSNKINLLGQVFIHRLRSLRKKWCRSRLGILRQKPNDTRDKLLDELDSIEDDLQTVEEGRISSRFDRNRILNSVEKSLSDFEEELRSIKRGRTGLKEDLRKEQGMPEEERAGEERGMPEVEPPIEKRLEIFDKEKKRPSGWLFGRKEKPVRERGEGKTGQPIGKMSLEDIRRRIKEIEEKDGL